MKDALAWFKKYSVLEWILLAQPIIDLGTALLQKSPMDTSLGVLLRMAFMVGLVIAVLFRPKSRLRTLTLIFVAVLIVYSGFFLSVMVTYKDTSVLFVEVKNLAKMFYFPVCFLGILTILDRSKTLFNRQVLVINAAVIAAILVIPTLFGLNFSSYTYNKFGSTGWFFSPNEISAIVTILLPFVFEAALKDKTQKIRLLYLGAYLIAILVIGTKVPSVGIVIMIGLTAISGARAVLRRAAKVDFGKLMPQMLVLATVLSMVTFLQFKAVKNQYVPIWDPDEIPVVPGVPKDNLDDIDPSVDFYKTLEPSQIKLLSLVFSSRDRYFMALSALMDDAPIEEKLVGMGYTDYDKVYKFSTHNIAEVDVLDVFFCYGWVGLGLFMAPLICVVIALRKRFIPRLKAWMSTDSLKTNMVSLTLIGGISLFSGHVLTAPAVSLYVAVILAMTLIEGKRSDDHASV